ncbi:hypothetical protein [Aminobacter sp. J15]|nr:hypothetical protein [Aminobacter sp. J15]
MPEVKKKFCGSGVGADALHTSLMSQLLELAIIGHAGEALQSQSPR